MYTLILLIGRASFTDNSDFPKYCKKPLLKTCQLSDGNLGTQLNAAIVQLASLQLH